MSSWDWHDARAPLLIAGPCVVEDDEVMARIADRLAALGKTLGVAVCFKASFDKANRSRAAGARGPGIERWLEALDAVRQRSGLPVLTDVHDAGQAAAAAQVVDVLQVPAFLSRQTDLLQACGATGKPVNVKKGQWMDPAAMRGAVEKVWTGGSRQVAVTERGTFFGYGDLVVDMRNFGAIKEAVDVPVLFDATHSVQRPGLGANGSSGGARDRVPALIRAAAAAGADGFFVETHPDPATALSDRETQWPLDQLEALLTPAVRVWRMVRER